MHIRLQWLFAAVLLLFQSTSLLAQTGNDTSSCSNFSCCTNDLTPAGVMISHVHSKKEWMISYRYMDMYMQGLLSGTRTESKEDVFTTYLMAPEKMNMRMHMLMGMYGVTDRFTVMAMLNYQFNSMDMSMFAANHVHGNTTMSSPNHAMKTSGLGDVQLYGLYGILQRSTYQFLVSLGVNIPTGNIHRKGSAGDPMYPNTNYPYNMQLGSGTVDLLPGATFLYQQNLMAIGSSISGIYRTSYNSIGYKLSNEFHFNSWIAYQWLKAISSSLRVNGNFSGTIQGRDPEQYIFLEPSANPSSYGSEKISAYIGTVFNLKGIFSGHQIGAEYGVPLYQRVSGVQLRQQYALNAFWSYRF